jgi:hypothetical protein
MAQAPEGQAKGSAMSADGSKAPKRPNHSLPPVGEWPLADAEITAWTDHYFNRTKEIVGRFGDQKVT